MDRAKALTQIKKELSKRTKVALNEGTTFREMGIDSLELLDLVVKVEKEFKIRIPDEKLIELKKVSDLLDIVTK